MDVSGDSASVPPLPHDLVVEILSYLVPPRPPVPAHLTAKSLQDRLKYLPPDPADLDAWLTPGVAEMSHPIATRLGDMAGDPSVGPGLVQYGYDGETAFARHSLTKAGAGQSADAQAANGVEVQYAYDPISNSWKYHGAFLPSPPTSQTSVVDLSSSPSLSPLDGGFSWHSSPSQLAIKSAAHEEVAPADYWAGFDSDGGHSDAGEGSSRARIAAQSGFVPARYDAAGGDMAGQVREEDYFVQQGEAPGGQSAEDDYWAQYSAAPSANPTPGISRRPSGLQALSTTSGDATSGGMPDSGTATGRQKQVDQVISALGALSPMLMVPKSPRSSTPSAPPLGPASTAPADRNAGQLPRGDMLRERLQMKAVSILRRAWKDWLGDATDQGAMEERAMGWLALARQAAQGAESTLSAFGNSGYPSGSGDDEAIRARIETVAELWEVMVDSNNGEEDAFYRMMEDAMKIRPGMERKYSAEQHSYWE